ncbi:MAG: hypothetical protein O3A00_03385 [Planctomycetota bacterium]|nr:hypothetical protein [Planctomycetota bacterium]
MTTPQFAGATTVVLLGASNVSISMRRILGLLQAGLTGTIDVWAACGFGRSYGIESKFLANRYTGITKCEMWEPLLATKPDRCVAMITDVGNDLLYGVDVDTIIEWAEWCLQKLAGLKTEVVISLPPIERVEQLSPWQFAIAQRILYPSGRGRLKHATVMTQVRQLTAEIGKLAERHGAQVVAPRLEWYGVDPIHIRRSRRTEAYSAMFSRWSCWSPPEEIGTAGDRKIGRLRPYEFRRFGRLKRTPQPVHADDGFRISMY